MKNYYFLAIPIAIGLFVGILISSEIENENPNLLTSKTLIENGSPISGNRNAKVTILEWGDYQCTFCYRFHESSLPIIHDEYIKTGRVNLVFKDFPLNGEDSVLAAEASYCAKDQENYWKYHDELYSNWGGERTGWIIFDSLSIFADNVGLELEEFNSCLNSHKYRQKVLALEQFGREMGIDATPSFLIFNDEKVIKIRGNQPVDSFRKVIEDLEKGA